MLFAYILFRVNFFLVDTRLTRMDVCTSNSYMKFQEKNERFPVSILAATYMKEKIFQLFRIRLGR